MCLFCRRVNELPGRLVDDHQVVVLVADVERQVFWLDVRRPHDVKRYDIARPDFGAGGIAEDAIHTEGAGVLDALPLGGGYAFFLRQKSLDGHFRQGFWQFDADLRHSFVVSFEEAWPVSGEGEDDGDDRGERHALEAHGADRQAGRRDADAHDDGRQEEVHRVVVVDLGLDEDADARGGDDAEEQHGVFPGGTAG